MSYQYWFEKKAKRVWRDAGPSLVILSLSDRTSFCNSHMNFIPESVAKNRISSTEDVGSDTEGQGVGETEEGGGDGEGTKGVENGLPWIACRVANADSADHSDVGIHVFREQEIENQKNSASDDVI